MTEQIEDERITKAREKLRSEQEKKKKIPGLTVAGMIEDYTNEPDLMKEDRDEAEGVERHFQNSSLKLIDAEGKTDLDGTVLTAAGVFKKHKTGRLEKLFPHK